MDEQQIRQIVREEIRGSDSSGRFGLNSIPRHIHNNIDSPFVFQPIMTFIGLIAADGVPAAIPSGWTVEIATVNLITNTYVITHNLDQQSSSGVTTDGSPSALYSVVTQVEAVANQFYAPQVVEYKNLFTVNWYNSAGSTEQISFNFILTLINNKSVTYPKYVGTSVI